MDVMEQEHRHEINAIPQPVFFVKKRLSEETKQELEELKNYFEDRKRKIKDLWQATVKVVKERHETNLALSKSLLLKQNQKCGPSTPDARRKKENNASKLEFGPEIRDQAVDFYKMWIGEFKKNASTQRQVVRNSMEKWFHFLRQLKDEPEPIQPVSDEDPIGKYVYYTCILVIFAMSFLFIFCPDYKFLDCNNELLVCLHKKAITLGYKIRNFYFKFHDISID